MTSHTCTPAWVSSLHLNSCSSNAIFACSAMAAPMYSCSSNVPARSNVSSECILCGDSKGSELQQPHAMPSARRSRSPRQRHPAGAEVLRLCNMLAQAGVPCIAVQLLGLVVLSKSWSKHDKLSHHSLLDAVEFFAGAETVASAFCARGFKTLGYDILLDSGSMDIMSSLAWPLHWPCRCACAGDPLRTLRLSAVRGCGSQDLQRVAQKQHHWALLLVREKGMS